MASIGEYIHADGASGTGVRQAQDKLGNLIDPHGGAAKIGYQITITGGTATVEIRAGRSGARAAGEMQVLRTVTASEMNAIVIPCPEFDFNITANTGSVTLKSWSTVQ